MPKMGFFIDMNKCSGCRACQIACKDRSDLPVGTLFRHVRTLEVGTYPDSRLFHFPQTCNHCSSPACIENCPTGAMQKLDDGSVISDSETCIGCGTCMKSCPYEIPIVDEEMKICQKCDSCKALRDAGKNPVCIDACLMRCIDFGNLEDIKAKYGSDLVSDQVFLPSSEKTIPSLLIKRRASIEGLEATEVIL